MTVGAVFIYMVSVTFVVGFTHNVEVRLASTSMPTPFYDHFAPTPQHGDPNSAPFTPNYGKPTGNHDHV